jgi:ADP-ribosyl-[dinitrogen reductase] hydrolase
MEINVYERALAAYLSFAVGDALGATTEFMLPREIADRYGVHKRIIGGGWLRLKAGQVTDDTEMSLALGDSIVENGGYSVTGAADHFVRWMKKKPVDIGSTVRRGLRDYMTKGQLVSPYSTFSAGNGAAMRILPAVIYCLKDWSAFTGIALSQCHITHNNELSDMGTLVFGEVTKALIETGDKLAALEIVAELIKKDPSFSHSKYNGEASGYIKDTFRTVMHYFFDSDKLNETIIRTVNQGGDADTNGALAGMLAGAYYGLEGISPKWLKSLDSNIIDLITKQTLALLDTPVKIIQL